MSAAAMAAAGPSRLPHAGSGSVLPLPMQSPSPLQTPQPEQVPNFFRPRYYTKRQTEAEAPSVKAGMTVKKVANMRRQYVKLITEICKRLGLNQYVACSAFTFCHHFYLVRVRAFFQILPGPARRRSLPGTVCIEMNDTGSAGRALCGMLRIGPCSCK